MPNVNLIEDEAGEGGMQPVSAPIRRKQGGGGGSKALVFLVVIVLVGGGVFALNKFGIIKLWGKKAKPAVTQIQEEPLQQEPLAADTMAATQDTSGIAFVETPPLTETTKTDMTMTAVESKLADMKGDYTIQVSAWRDKVSAEKYTKKLEEAGYPAFIERRKVKDGEWYTVRIGRYPSIKEAKRAVETFAYELKSNYWIDRVRMQ